MIFIKIPKIQENNIQLYIGDANASMNKDILKENNVTHIINCAIGIPCFFKSEFEYIELFLNDEFDDILKHKAKIVSIVEKCKIQNGNLFVHCAFGKSRSAAIICLILMLENNVSFDNAHSYLSKIHNEMDINPFYIKTLQKFSNVNHT